MKQFILKYIKSSKNMHMFGDEEIPGFYVPKSWFDADTHPDELKVTIEFEKK